MTKKEPQLSAENAHIIRIMGMTPSFKGIVEENMGETGLSVTIREASELSKLNLMMKIY